MLGNVQSRASKQKAMIWLQEIGKGEENNAERDKDGFCYAKKLLFQLRNRSSRITEMRSFKGTTFDDYFSSKSYS